MSTEPQTMRTLVATKYGKPEIYEYLDVPVPKVQKPDEILIKVHASSVNPVDVKLAAGMAKQITELPFKIGYDVSGVVVAVGSSVPSHLAPGTEVYSRVPQEYRGTVSDYVLNTASATSVKPSSLTHNEAASLPLVALTALQAFDAAAKHLEGGLEGKTVYLPGGLSGIGSIALQLAKKVFRVGKVITTLSTSKVPKLAGLVGDGVADQVVDYTKEDPTKVIARGSIDFMLDTMDTGLASLHLMKKGGYIVTVAGLPFRESLSVYPNINGLARVALNTIGGIKVARAWRYSVGYRHLFVLPMAEDLDRLRGWIEEGLVKPVVGRVAKIGSLQEVRDGCTEVYSGKGGIGKFVVEVVSDN